MISKLSSELNVERVAVGLSRQVERMGMYGTYLLLFLCCHCHGSSASEVSSGCRMRENDVIINIYIPVLSGVSNVQVTQP